MKCVTCQINNCYKCVSGPFRGMRLKENPVHDISFNDDIEAIQKATVGSSIGGMQTKVQAKIKRGRMEFMAGGDFILKPRPQGEYRFRDDVPFNEHVTMRIAGQVFNFDVARNGIVVIDEQPVYITKRFDIRGNERVVVENFLQLLQMSSQTHGRNYKYEKTYEELGTVIDNHFLGPKVQKLEMLRRVLFNNLIGNGDAHPGNFSGMITSMGNYKLTPIYDVLNTSLHTPGEAITALPLFEDHETEFYRLNGFYGRPCFEDLGRRYGLGEEAIEKALEDIINREKIDTAIEYVAQSPLSDQGKEAFITKINDRYDVLTR